MPDPNQIALTLRSKSGAGATAIGQALTSTQMDDNLINLANGVTGDFTKFLVAHETNGSIKTTSGTVNGSALSDATVGYDKLSTLFYAEDSNADVNQITVPLTGLTAAPAIGSVIYIKVNGTNTDSVTMNVTTGSVTTQGPIKKNGTTANLVSGDLQNNQIIAVAYAGSNTFHLLSNLSVSDPGIVKIATVESDVLTHAPSSDRSQITSYSLASNSYSRIIMKATVRMIAGHNVDLTAQFYKGTVGVAPSYEIPQMQVPSSKAYSDSSATASTDIKYAPWQTLVAEFDGGNPETETIYLYKEGTSADYKAELDFLEVYGVI